MSHRQANTRRRLLQAAAAAGLLALPGLLAGTAYAQKQHVTMRLDWLYQGPNSGFMVAKAKGFYDQEGLDVDMGPGRGSGSTAQLIASKASMFGFSDGYVVGLSVAKGMNITMVAAIYRRNPSAIVVLRDSGIKTMKDLEGKTVGIPTGGTGYQQWPAALKGCHVDGSKIHVVNLDPAGAVPALVTGKVQAIGGYAQGFVPGVEIRGKKPARALWYADCGVNAVSNGIIVNNDLLKSDPGVIRKFVKATIRGFLYARQHPDEMVAIVKKFSQATVPAITRREFEISLNTWVTPNTAGKPLGWMSQKDWEDTVDVLKQYGGVKEPLKASQLYTNEFVPTGSEFVPPQH